MTGCQTCGGFGNRHDPVAHGWVREQDDPHHYESHTWDDQECIVCGISWTDCVDVCPEV